MDATVTVIEIIAYGLSALAIIGTGIAWGVRLEILTGNNKTRIAALEKIQSEDHDLLIRLNTKVDLMIENQNKAEDRMETFQLKIDGSLSKLHDKMDRKVDKAK